ncbi:MAG TPA: type II toxin-antitoxin system Phd/YefM family antitoxin [Candidatus Binataceae bacterium]|nr:type II toxin-antitoxin system Phd/YefM family antitoxin [Candidatus Binataceae bacterium]
MAAKKKSAARKTSQGLAVTTAAARRNFSEVINRAAYGKDRIVLTRRHRPVAAVVPIEDVEWLEELEDREDLKAARAASREADVKGTIPLDDVLNEFNIKR